MPPKLSTYDTASLSGGSIKAIVTYAISPLAPIGTSYSFQATDAAGTGQVSLLPARIAGLPQSSCNKTVAPPPISIGAAKLLPVGSTVHLKGKVCTAVFGLWKLFYIEERDRPAGIGVQYTGPTAPVAQYDTVSVLVTTFLLGGAELIIQPTKIATGPALLPTVRPVGMNNKWTGGGLFGGQPAVYDQAVPPPGIQSVGLSNVGLLVRAWGLVTWHDWAFVAPTVSGPCFWIDDGSNLNDGFLLAPGSHPGVACYYGFCGHGSFPDIGEYWGVTGILRAIPNANLTPQPVRLLVPRAYPEDLDQYRIGP